LVRCEPLDEAACINRCLQSASFRVKRKTEKLMTKFKLIGAALALALPAAAFAAGSCADMACCKEGADCCKEKDGKKADCCAGMKDGNHGDDHAGHDMSKMPKK
jgi:hypothetical protein